MSSPLHLHPNDSATLTVVSIKLKGTENYQVWSCAMLLALEGKNKTGFIDGTCRRSNTDEILGRQWDRVNAIVLGWILNSISEELFLGQIFSKRAKHVWDELKETYDKVDGSVTFNLHHKINSLRQNGTSIADYYHRLNALWKQFDALVQLPRCTCHAAEDFYKRLFYRCLACYFLVRNLIELFLQSSVDHLTDLRLLCFNSSVRIGVLARNPKLCSSSTFSDDQLSKIISLIKDNSLNNGKRECKANMAGGDSESSGVGIWGRTGDQISDGLYYFNDKWSRYVWGVYVKREQKGDCFALENWLLDIRLLRAYTPHKMVIVERKHRHLLNVARSLLFQGGLPLNLWSECIMTAAYLINRLPSSVLNGKSPFELVFDRKPGLKHLRGYATFKNRIRQPQDVNLACQDLDHVNFFDEIVYENPDTSNDDHNKMTRIQSDVAISRIHLHVNF
ncbi:ribonuclease H-like domain-containing protein [Tanacetum coccineum]